MRIELRDKPEENKEPVVKLWLERDSSGSIALYYQIDDDFSDSLAYFNEEEKTFHVFGNDVRKLGYKVTATGVDIQEEQGHEHTIDNTRTHLHRPGVSSLR